MFDDMCQSWWKIIFLYAEIRHLQFTTLLYILYICIFSVMYRALMKPCVPNFFTSKHAHLIQEELHSL